MSIGGGKESVAITGIGVVSALGNDLSQFWENCLSGTTRVDRIPTRWSQYYKSKSEYWSPLDLPDYGKYGLKRSDTLALDVAVLNAIVAADDALAAAAIDKTCIDERNGRYTLDVEDVFRAGVFVGTGLGCITSTLQNYVPHLIGPWAKRMETDRSAVGQGSFEEELLANYETQPRVSPVASFKSMANSLSSQLSIRYGARGANETIVAACASGASAIAHAFRAIQSGELDMAIAGGSEYYGDWAGGVFMAFDRLNTLAKANLPLNAANRPFDRQRTGFLFSQGGACMLVLESSKRVARRGIYPFANIIGAAGTCDARSLAAIYREDNSIREMLTRALWDARISAKDVDYVNAHGTSTEQNDEIEAEIIADVFRDDVLVNSTKSLLGHTIGAAGALEAAVTALSVFRQEVHPSVNLDDPVRDLNFVTKQRRSERIKYAMSNSYGFGGHNIGLLFAAGQ